MHSVESFACCRCRSLSSLPPAPAKERISAGGWPGCTAWACPFQEEHRLALDQHINHAAAQRDLHPFYARQTAHSGCSFVWRKPSCHALPSPERRHFGRIVQIKLLLAHTEECDRLPGSSSVASLPRSVTPLLSNLYFMRSGGRGWLQRGAGAAVLKSSCQLRATRTSPSPSAVMMGWISLPPYPTGQPFSFPMLNRRNHRLAAGVWCSMKTAGRMPWNTIHHLPSGVSTKSACPSAWNSTRCAYGAWGLAASGQDSNGPHTLLLRAMVSMAVLVPPSAIIQVVPIADVVLCADPSGHLPPVPYQMHFCLAQLCTGLKINLKLSDTVVAVFVRMCTPV